MAHTTRSWNGACVELELEQCACSGDDQICRTKYEHFCKTCGYGEELGPMTEARTEWRVAYEEWGNDNSAFVERESRREYVACETYAKWLGTRPGYRNVRVQQRTVTEWVDA